MKVSRGDVVLVDIPQSPGQPANRRPALVVQSDHNNTRLTNAIFAMITSNVSLANREPTQLLIDVAAADGKLSGLAQTSAVKCENLYTLSIASVSKKLGSLPVALMAKVDSCRKVSLGL